MVNSGKPKLLAISPSYFFRVSRNNNKTAPPIISIVWTLKPPNIEGVEIAVEGVEIAVEGVVEDFIKFFPADTGTPTSSSMQYRSPCELYL